MREAYTKILFISFSVISSSISEELASKSKVRTIATANIFSGLNRTLIKTMEIGMVSVLSASFLIMLVSSVMSIPLDVASRSENQHIEEKRPKYMDTRDLDAFKKLVWLSLQELAAEERINPDMIDVSKDEDAGKESPEKKAERSHLRICIRRSGSQFIPYPCYRRGRR